MKKCIVYKPDGTVLIVINGESLAIAFPSNTPFVYLMDDREIIAVIPSDLLAILTK